ncbi:flagellar brake protein [Pseudomonas jilinensis]|uniref:Pilus assembly protein PilZ n=1 Tax=Pseudomonas jilinensis TaxID=2078689 RepID=A0A396S0D6_9PSED|nr:flagellar brake protein [Pseudomonas jilinensis]RHW21966.1 pilus assembly protein PilZ [Pseudomonas jilinensis]
MSNLFEEEAGPQPPREIRSSIEILALLKGLQQHREPLKISFDDRHQAFQSFIVQLDNDRLWIDELIPLEGNRYMSQQEAFQVDAWRDGVHIRWYCPSARQVMLDDAPAFETSLPLELTYHQKRGAFRAAVARGLNTKLGLVHSQRSYEANGQLIDISATGCKIRLAGAWHERLQPGEVFDLSYLELPDSGRMPVSVEIRHCHYDANQDETQVGIKFKQASPNIQRQIDRFVNQLQREARRFEKNDLF